MAANATPRTLRAPRTQVPLLSRLFGLGSVFGKTIRDSRRATLLACLGLGGVMLLVSAGITKAYPTQAARDEIARVAAEMGAAAQGLAGKPVNIGTIGGYVEWKYGPIFLIIAALWSILALSATLGGEARRGSLEFVAVTTYGRRRLAASKLAGHLAAMTLVTVVMIAAAWLAGVLFAALPGESIPPQAAVGFGLWIGLVALAFGGLAFALSPFFGRSAAAWLAGFALLGGWVLAGYEASVPLFRPIAALTPWSWTQNHVPLGGQYDWASLVPTAVAAIVLFAAGIEAFARRDLGAATSLPLPHLPSVTLGLRGPVTRSLGERLPVALAWGFGLGVFGLAMAAASHSLADGFAQSPDVKKTFETIFPSTDVTTVPGLMQLLIGQLGYIVVGLAAAALVAGWASDETSGRLEMLVAQPLSRARWLVRGALGVFVAIGVLAATAAIGFAIGSLVAGDDVLRPIEGTIPLALYMAALAGIGFAVGGRRPSLAAELVAVVAVVTFFLDLLGPVLQLPEAVRQLALTVHLGRPIVGSWDWPGMAVCLVLAAGGTLLGAWFVSRRDVSR